MRPSRRSFLKAVPAVTAGTLLIPASSGAGQSAGRAGGVAHSSFDPWVEIFAANLRHNVQEISRLVARRPILAVVKNNGYGLGVVQVGRLLEPEGAIAGFAVVKSSEALALRDGGVKKPVLLMGPFDEAALETMVGRDVMPMVYTEAGDMLDRVSAKLKRSVPIHVCVDTGLGRVGVPYANAGLLVRDLARRKSVRIQGIQMTFSEDPALDLEQLRRFLLLCDSLRKDGIDVGRRHTASSFALFQHPDGFLDMVRPGMAVYGIYPEQKFRTADVLDLRPAVALRARVAYVKRLPAGESAGYERAYIARDDTWIATLPVGHADGWPRATAKGAKVRIGDTAYPVVASISASHTIVEIGPVRTLPQSPVKAGDVVTLFDWEAGSRPEDVSAACGASVYDLTMHLSASLPRRVV
jgi:alanine racemase